jgi:hypothetical protein
MSQDSTPKVCLELTLHEAGQPGALAVPRCVGEKGLEVGLNRPVEHGVRGLAALVHGRGRADRGHGLRGEHALCRDQCSQVCVAAAMTWRSGGGQECGRGVGEGIRGRFQEVSPGQKVPWRPWPRVNDVAPSTVSPDSTTSTPRRSSLRSASS